MFPVGIKRLETQGRMGSTVNSCIQRIEIMKHKYLITIDGGTSNTRVYLWDGPDNLIGEKKASIGVRNSAIDGNNHALCHALHEMLMELLQDERLNPDDIIGVYVSGMLTSAAGIYELPHITAPVGLDELAKGVRDLHLPEIWPGSVSLIPGVRNTEPDQVFLENLSGMDVMRGEETEAIALIPEISEGQGAVLILPGSHTKVIFVDSAHKIVRSLTTMSGELLQLLTQNSILADTTKKEFLSGTPDHSFLMAGYHEAKQSRSLSRAVFLTRVAGMFVNMDLVSVRSFLLGAVLENDVTVIQSEWKVAEHFNEPICIAGKGPFATGLYDLLQAEGYSNSFIYRPKDNRPLSGKGAWKIYEERSNDISGKR